MEPIAIPLRHFLVSLGFNEHKLDIKINYTQNEKGVTVGKIIAERPIDE
jgi:hypothetical protein